MKFIKHFLLLVIFSASTFAEDKPKFQNLDELLIEVQKSVVQQRPEFRKREAVFIKSRNRQRFLLNQAKAELKKEELIMVRLQAQFEAQEKSLRELEDRLAVVMGTLGELFGVVKQVAGDTKAQLKTSIISAEYPRRFEFPGKIAERKELPDTSDLEKLWFTLQKEMVESGKVTKFERELVRKNGKKKTYHLTRVGSFNLVSQGKYFTYQPETNQVVELPKQVSWKYLSLIKKLEKSKKSFVPFGLDPSRGSLISLLIQTPSLPDRISQGGLVGYIILLTLLFGLVFVAERFWKLRKQERLFVAQIQSGKILDHNPLGELMKIFERNQSKDTEVLELKMDEAIVKQSAQLQKGIGTIKLLAVLSPLLGLLGTVTGMIVTFQSITLFGTGDPKLMAGGISQALITTVLGLTSAIPLILLHHFLSSKAKNLIRILEEESLGMFSRRAGK